jgi:hypothetical protein
MPDSPSGDSPQRPASWYEQKRFLGLAVLVAVAVYTAALLTVAGGDDEGEPTALPGPRAEEAVEPQRPSEAALDAAGSEEVESEEVEPERTPEDPAALPGEAESGEAAPPPPSGDGEVQQRETLADGGWTVVSFELREDVAGDFEGIAQIRNDEARNPEAGFSIIIREGDEVVTTLFGFGTGIDPGETQEVTFVGSTAYRVGDYRAEFRWDF